jgi:uncharacterized membrane protein YgcG
MVLFAISFQGLAAAAEDDAAGTVLNHLTMNQWVSATDSGGLSGRVVLPKPAGEAEALADVSVAILARDGEVLRAKTNQKGEFEIAGVEPGVYALTARGDHVFAACAMHVVSQSEVKNLDFPRTVQISMANVDYTVVNTALIRYLPPSVKKQQVEYDSVNLGQLQSRVCGQDLFRVAQDGNGMKGRLHVAGAKIGDLNAASHTNVFLFKDTMEIDRALSDDQGKFNFANLDPGFYSILAIGPNGIGLIGFELVDPATIQETASVVAKDGTRLVGLFGHRKHGCGCCQEFAMQVAPMPEICNVVEEVIVEETCGCGEVVVDQPCGCGEADGGLVDGEVLMDGYGTPLAGGGYGGGFSGGGGGFYGGGGGGGGFLGGGGGLGGLAGLAGLAAVLASDNNNNTANFPIPAPVVTSPAAAN